LAAAKKLLAEAQAQVQQLQATVKGQQATIKQLQVRTLVYYSYYVGEAPQATLKHFRHTHATFLLSSGINPSGKVVKVHVG